MKRQFQQGDLSNDRSNQPRAVATSVGASNTQGSTLISSTFPNVISSNTTDAHGSNNELLEMINWTQGSQENVQETGPYWSNWSHHEPHHNNHP